MNTGVKVVVILALAGVVAFPLHRWYSRQPWCEFSAHFKAERGSVNCGHVTDGINISHKLNPAAAVQCALTANKDGHPFIVVFSVHGQDEQLTSAIVGDSDENAVEILYPTGMFEAANSLVRHRCATPAQLTIEKKYYPIPRLHCEPWPPPALERDYLFW